MSALERALTRVAPLDAAAMAAARERQGQLTKPPGSLGRLEELAVQLAGIAGTARPLIGDRVIVVCAADHGVAAAGVSAYPAAVTAQMVHNFVRGGAAINVLARQAGARVVVADLGVDHDFPRELPVVHAKLGRGTASLLLGPAMTRAQARGAVEVGIEMVAREAEQFRAAARGDDVLVVGTGDMGIGNTTASSAIVAAMTGAPVAEVTGRGTGIDDATWARKVAAIERGLEVNRPDASDALDVLAKVGGFEIGGLAGVMVGAAAERLPVVIDGFISGAAALIAVGLCPGVRDYLMAAHRSVEVGHRVVLDRLGLRPLLELDLRLGEGTGAALAMQLLDAAVAIHNGMATFDEAGVSGPA
ncbi:MAG TPA: nicotinate-nucleotide--dimethylbenzimidazole phosphoribosyltransferase [Chloroflexota bacterium]|nr:nicotinate-nucleotide--dimethylbenzimidazole phosphoribosyltransferase [Chloroflexota bacterium]